MSLLVSASVVYAGASDLAVEGEWLWVDGATFSGPWGPGQPNNMGGDQHCIVMETAYGYNFSDVSCFTNYKFLCQTPVLTLSDICISPYNYDSFLDICWRLEDSLTDTWQNARNVCMSEGGDLMILKSEVVHTYIKGVLPLSKYDWFLLKFSNITHLEYRLSCQTTEHEK